MGQHNGTALISLQFCLCFQRTENPFNYWWYSWVCLLWARPQDVTEPAKTLLSIHERASTKWVGSFFVPPPPFARWVIRILSPPSPNACFDCSMLNLFCVSGRFRKCLGQCSEAEFLDKILTKVLRVFLLAIHNHIYSFALRFLFLETHTTSHSFYSSVTVHCKGESKKSW